jgi:Fe-S cluster assembly protein SufB
VKPEKRTNAQFSQCDSLLLGNQCSAHTFRHIEVKNSSSAWSTGDNLKISEIKFFIATREVFRRGTPEHDCERLLQEVFKELPMEFAVRQSYQVSLGQVGKKNLEKQPILEIRICAGIQDKQILKASTSPSTPAGVHHHGVQ